MKSFTHIEEIAIDVINQFHSEMGKYLDVIDYPFRNMDSFTQRTNRAVHRKIHNKTLGRASRVFKRLRNLDMHRVP